MQMRAARMYGYQEPLRIEEFPVPAPAPDEILLKVAAAGMCRSDYQLLDGYFKGPFPVEFPYIPGHEITGRVAGLGTAVPTSSSSEARGGQNRLQWHLRSSGIPVPP
ncbi:alcohol dehydrogenase catalytic domain-containing protein [Nocardia sp. NPDC004604]|uniref:alcohol dehydrogenase catalytic domain-containing protein n=1 Tax=Nocardia sp. NPDC004604 TaxID=3157013 RepID=UPI0033A049A6